jgi:hypothetical protein
MMTMLSTARSTLAAVLSLAMLAGLLVLCPCPGMPEMASDHGCCAPEGLRARTECCSEMAQLPDPALAAAAATVAADLAPAVLPAPLEIVTRAAPAVSSPIAFFSSPPTVLRI